MIQEIAASRRLVTQLVASRARVSGARSLAVHPSGRELVALTLDPRGRPSAALVSRRGPGEHGPEWPAWPVHPDAYESEQATVACGPEGDIHLAWLARSGAKGARWLLYTRSEDLGASWTAPTLLHDPRRDGDASEPQLSVDGQGRAHLVWSAARHGETPARVWHAAADPRSAMSAPLALNSRGDARLARASMNHAAAGVTAVAWIDERYLSPRARGGDVVVGVFDEPGAPPREQRLTYSGDAVTASVLVDRGGVLHATWATAGGQVCYAQSTQGGQTWHDGAGAGLALEIQPTRGAAPTLGLGLHPFREVIWLVWSVEDAERYSGEPDGGLVFLVSPNTGAEWFEVGRIKRRLRGAVLSDLCAVEGADLRPRLCWSSSGAGSEDQVWFAEEER